MLEAFKQNIKKTALFKSNEPILLAVSGGMDSVCMCHLFKMCRYSFAIAHCNFKLRGAESDADEQFVKSIAQTLEVPFYSKSFQTEAYATSEKISIQMAARDLRYEWLESIRSTKQYRSIATAHHLNDSIETVVYNFSKGCGIRGLHGILPKQGKVIRPLIYAQRAEIENFVQTNGLEFREDASNTSDKYSRNFIRHQIIPALKKLNPSFEKSAGATIQKIRGAEFLFQEAIERYRSKVLEQKGEEYYLHHKKIPENVFEITLYELLHPFGFNGDQVENLVHQDHQSGAIFYSASHTLLIDRTYYIIREKKTHSAKKVSIEASTRSVVVNNFHLLFEHLDQLPAFFPNHPSEAFLDVGQLDFPLTLRPWVPGDVFQPFGMNGRHQKLQDFLTHRKLNRFEKEQVYVLESAGKICWVVGMRLDERFKITEATNTAYHIKLIEFKS